MTWDAIVVTAKKFNHAVSCDSLCKSAKNRLQELELDDLDELVSLRVSSKKRIWAIRQGQHCLLLWWDPDHEVCPSEKKNT